MPAHPRRSASAKGGTSSGSWSSGTPSARRPEDEIRAPTTLVEAIHTRSRTWVQFPPSPLLDRTHRTGGFGLFTVETPARRQRCLAHDLGEVLVEEDTS